MTVETDEVVVLRRREPSLEAWCARCASRVRFVLPEQAAAASDVTSRTIYRWVDSERVHYLETPDGRLWVCPDSLPSGKS